MDGTHKHTVMVCAGEIGNRYFRDHSRSLRDFLDSDDANSKEAAEVAAHILVYFCTDGDQVFNGFVYVIQLAIAFLDATFDSPRNPTHRTQALKDLKAILDRGVDAKAIVGWVDSHYA